MSKKDRGWDYLNSDDINKTFNDNDDSSWGYKNEDGSGSYHGADGSWGYQNADGSSSYHGADGSWGYQNADGSSSYHGADGSWGYKNADGSGSYHGADGSWGYKNADGSGSYHGADGSWGYSDADGNSSYFDGDTDVNSSCNESSSNDIDLVSGIAGLAIGLGAVAISKFKEKSTEKARKEAEYQAELEREAEEKRRMELEKKEHDRRIRNKRLKAFFFNKKNLCLEVSTYELVGKDYKEVLKILADAGFNNSKAVPIKDIYIGDNKFVGEVEQVIINDQPYLDKGTMVPYDAEIIITYHMKKEIEFPFTSRQLSKMTFEQVEIALINLGFINIYSFPLNDLKTGWIKKENMVQQVVITGEESIKKGMLLEYDQKFTIQYHSLSNKYDKWRR